jgi:hypothetical protein
MMAIAITTAQIAVMYIVLATTLDIFLSRVYATGRMVIYPGWQETES